MKKGFTLAEMVIVIAIIAIVSAIAIPNASRMRIAGNISKAKGDLRALQSAAENYYIHHNNTYPSALSNLTSATPRIIYSLPLDPFNSGRNYGYSLSPAGAYYVMYSIGSVGDGNASVSDTGNITETDDPSCIFVSNAAEDDQP
jgi:prepilin-type N-terminal cleavage/methylation domain-containing protein